MGFVGNLYAACNIHGVQVVSVKSYKNSLQDLSEPEPLMEEFEPHETNLIGAGDNSNDENDVDVETMSGELE